MSAVDVHGLPELPECWTGSPVTVTWAEDGEQTSREVYTADQMRKYARAAVEAALRQSGEAVAWRVEWDAARKTYWIQYHDETDPLPESWDDKPKRIIPLYTAPPATSGLVKALRAAHAFVSKFTSGNDTPVDVKHVAARSGEAIAQEATRLRDDFILPALAAHDAGGGR